jgi:hypothetical protein
VYDNPLAFFRQSVRWQAWPEESAKRNQERKMLIGSGVE